MDVIRCGIDVGHHRVDRGVGVRQKARGVATHGMEPADRVAEQKEMLVTLGNGGCEGRRVPSGVTRDRRHALEDCVQPLHAATADVHLAQEQIGEHAQQREHQRPPPIMRRLLLTVKFQQRYEKRHGNGVKTRK